MKESKLLWHSLGHSILVLLYVSLVASIMSNGSRWFGVKDNSWTPVAVLMLLVLSATITGTLVLGRPLIMFLDGAKKEALKFFGYTIGWLFLLTIIVFAVMLSIK